MGRDFLIEWATQLKMLVFLLLKSHLLDSDRDDWRLIREMFSCARVYC